jgi:hypothetical protein
MKHLAAAMAVLLIGGSGRAAAQLRAPSDTCFHPWAAAVRAAHDNQHCGASEILPTALPRLSHDVRLATVDTQSVSRNTKKGALIGGVLGLAAGAITGAALSSYCANCQGPLGHLRFDAPFAIVGAVSGVAIGAATGSVIGSMRR